jgi:rRNA pseudouridine-1189 N-methylase Emg1 (Nep1/Mra1 family)
MGAIELKNNILEIINNADEQLLKVVKNVIDNYQDDEVVAFSVNGNSLTRNQYKSELKNAIDEIKRGDFVTQEDLETESKTW